MPAVKKAKKAQKNEAPAKKKSKVNPEKTVVSGQLEKKIRKQEAWKARQRGVVLIKHLPHGFFEQQIRSYFQQFGKVTRLRLSRSPRTGGSKGFAFVEFEHPEVAQIAAETMDNYLMFNKFVKASYIPPEKQQFDFFRTSVKKVKNKAGKEIFVSNKTAAVNRKVKEHNNWTASAYQKRSMAEVNKIKKLNERYAHLGLDFSKVLVAPKLLSEEDKAKNETENKSVTEVVADALKKQKDAPTLHDLLGESIQEDSQDEDFIAESDSESEGSEDEKAVSKHLSTKDLLNETISDDSGDEDFVPLYEDSDNANSDNEEPSAKKQKKGTVKKGSTLEELLLATSESDDEDWQAISGEDSEEESAGTIKEEDHENTEESEDSSNSGAEDDENNNSSDEDDRYQSLGPKLKNQSSKSVKTSKAELLDRIIQRKPKLGGVQKKPTKKPNSSSISNKKRALQVNAAKQIAKPLTSVKIKEKKKAKKPRV